MTRRFSTGDMKHTKRYSASSVIRVLQIQTHRRHLTPMRMVKTEKPILSVGRMWRNGSSPTLLGNRRSLQTLWLSAPTCPCASTPRYLLLLANTCPHKNLHECSLFHRQKVWIPKCPSMGEWTNKEILFTYEKKRLICSLLCLPSILHHPSYLVHHGPAQSSPVFENRPTHLPILF